MFDAMGRQVPVRINLKYVILSGKQIFKVKNINVSGTYLVRATLNGKVGKEKIIVK